MLIRTFLDEADLQEPVSVGRSNEPQGGRVRPVVFPGVLEQQTCFVLEALLDLPGIDAMLVLELFHDLGGDLNRHCRRPWNPEQGGKVYIQAAPWASMVRRTAYIQREP